MKRLTCLNILLILVIVISSACSPDQSNTETSDQPEASDTAQKENQNKGTSPENDEIDIEHHPSIEAARAFAKENNIPDEDLLVITRLLPGEEDHVYGIDVSHHQDDVDWKAVKATGVHFAYIKASEGVDWEDPHFVQNWAESKVAGLRRGAYHMFRPEDTSVEQIDNFVKTLKAAGMDADMLPPVLDVEQVHTMDDVNRDVMHERILEWMVGVERATGMKPVIYTNPKFWEGYLSNDKDLLNYGLWISEYDMDATEPSTTGAWSDYMLWQFSRYGIVPGVSKTVDLNRAKKEQIGW